MFFDVFDRRNVIDLYYTEQGVNTTLPFGDKTLYTWEFNNKFLYQNVKFLHLYTQGATIKDYGSPELIEQYKNILELQKKFLKTFKTSQVSTFDHCFYYYLPEWFLEQYFSFKISLMKETLQYFEEPQNYHFLKNISEVLLDIETREIRYSPELDLKQKYNNIQYNVFGAKTGRLTTSKHSFPILTLPKEQRKYVLPSNDELVEVDFNAADVRSLLILLDRPQLTGDIHRYHLELLKDPKMTRDTVKNEFFAWLFGRENPDFDFFDTFYHKAQIKEKYWDGKCITNPYGRKIEADEYHILSYLIQSTSADIFLRQVIKVFKYLKQRHLSSFIKFLVHDNIVLDMKKDEMEHIPNIRRIFSETDHGTFETSIRKGKNFLEMDSL